MISSKVDGRVCRMNIVINARRYGATNQQIGDALGITETAVRRMVTRHGDA